jgi:3-deoxy-D-arabino-heptulosonate 7-phosphate (DAHP) synthase
LRENWQERFAETPDVLIAARRERTLVRVRDVVVGGDQFITMAGPCSVETERQQQSCPQQATEARIPEAAG